MTFIQLGRRIINVEAIEDIQVYEEGERFEPAGNARLSARTVIVSFVSGEKTFLTGSLAEVLLEELEVSRKLSGASTARLGEFLVENEESAQDEEKGGGIVISVGTWNKILDALELLRDVEKTTLEGERSTTQAANEETS